MGKFKSGESGNPKGKPKGTLHKATRAAQELLDGEVQELTRKCIELAKEGNVVALRLCLERIIPPRKDRPMSLKKLPKVEGAADIPKVMEAVLKAVAQGEITPGEGQAVAAMLEAYRKGVELAEFETRLTALEERV
jgi:hypothetical protein